MSIDCGKSTNGSRWKINGVCLLLSVLYITIILRRFPAVLPWDEYGLSFLASGKLGGVPTIYVPYLNICFSGILKLLYSVFPDVEWFTVLMLIILCFSIWAILRKTALVFLESTGSTAGGLVAGAAGLILVHALFFYFITEIRFTYTAAAVAIALIWCLGGTGKFHGSGTGSAGTEKRSGDQVILLLLFVIVVTIRKSIFSMAVPFLSMIFLFAWKKTDRRRLGRQALAAVLLAIVLIGTDSAVWRVNKEEFITLNKYRTQIQDYGGMPDYDGHESLYRELGITGPEYDLMDARFWGMAGHAKADTLKKIAEVRDAEKQQTIKKAVRNIFSGQKNVSPAVYAAIIILFLVNLSLGIMRKDHRLLGISLCTLLLWLAECLYLQWGGRVIFRAVYPLDTAALTVFLVLLRDELAERAAGFAAVTPRAERRRAGLLFAAGAFLLMLAVNTTADNLKAYDTLAETNRQYRTVIQYAEERKDNLCLIVSDLSRTYRLDGGTPDNLVKLTGWIGITSEWQDRVAGGRESVAAALLERTDIRIIADMEYRMDFLEEYLNGLEEQPGISISLVCEEEISAGEVRYRVWKVEKAVRNGEAVHCTASFLCK